MVGDFKISTIWKFIFLILLIVDAILSYFLYSSSGYGIGLIKLSFLLLPIVNLLLLFGYTRFITEADDLELLKIGFIILTIVNIMFGFNIYDQARYGIGLGFIGVVPLIFVIAINDLVVVLFYIKTQHHQGVARVISYTVLIFISIVLAFSFLNFLPIFL